MAMTMSGEVQLPASREVVWAKLNDTDTLKACVPGCEMLDKLSDTEFQAIATMKVGPVKARWKGKVRLSDLDPPNGYRISGEGEGGVAGFAKGGADRRACREGWRHALVLQRGSPDRRQARPARPAPDQQRRQEDGRRFLRQVRTGGEVGLIAAGFSRSIRAQRPLTGPAAWVLRVELVPGNERGQNRPDFAPLCLPARRRRRNNRAFGPDFWRYPYGCRRNDGERQARHR